MAALSRTRICDGPLELSVEARRPEGVGPLTGFELALLSEMLGTRPTETEDGCIRACIALPDISRRAALLAGPRLLEAAFRMIGAHAWARATITAAETTPVPAAGVTSGALHTPGSIAEALDHL